MKNKFLSSFMIVFCVSTGAWATISPKSVVGKYSDSECQATHCDEVQVSNKSGGLKLSAPSIFDGEIPVYISGKAGVFSKEFQQDCDDPGCGNLMKVYGIIYEKNWGNKTSITVRLKTLTEYLHPEEESDHEGEVTETFYFVKK